MSLDFKSNVYELRHTVPGTRKVASQEVECVSTTWEMKAIALCSDVFASPSFYLL